MSNSIKTLFKSMVGSAVKYSAAAEAIRAMRADGTTDDKAARNAALDALLETGRYAGQLTERGRPAQGSALQRALSRLMRDTAPEGAPKADRTRQPVRVPRTLQQTINGLLAEYSAAQIRAALKRAAE